MGQYLIDNNAISNFFSGNFTEKGMDFMAQVLDQTPIISVITEIEALSWINIDKSKEKIVNAFIQDAIVLALTPAVVSRCVSIRRSRKIKTPDAIIAASAIVHDLILITSDSDFNNITGLNIADPLKL
ncbi:MAG: type II toxin-antitoxin system VapC family toxin [Cytophagales bacterium]